jgi:hypothetical protein
MGCFSSLMSVTSLRHSRRRLNGSLRPDQVQVYDADDGQSGGEHEQQEPQQGEDAWLHGPRKQALPFPVERRLLGERRTGRCAPARHRDHRLASGQGTDRECTDPPSSRRSPEALVLDLPAMAGKSREQPNLFRCQSYPVCRPHPGTEKVTEHARAHLPGRKYRRARPHSRWRVSGCL